MARRKTNDLEVRDFFALAAMHALLMGHYRDTLLDYATKHGKSMAGSVADNAYSMADAMLARRKEK